MLVDIGAGIGFFSLAAAARGHRSIAFELAPASLESLQASIDYNGFQNFVTVHQVGPNGVIQILYCPSECQARNTCCTYAALELSDDPGAHSCKALHKTEECHSSTNLKIAGARHFIHTEVLSRHQGS